MKAPTFKNMAAVFTACLLHLAAVESRAADGPALAVDGIDDYASAPERGTFSLGILPFTIEGFFYLPDNTEGESETVQSLIYLPSAYAMYVEFHTLDPDDIVFLIWPASGSPIELRGSSNLLPGWHHIAAIYVGQSYAGQNLRAIYLDGQRIAYSTDAVAPSGVHSSPGPLYVGGGGNTFFRGRIDEVRISATLRYIGSSNSVPTSPFAPDIYTAALWHFDEPAGSTNFLDSSGYDNTLTGVNGAQTVNPAGPPTVLSIDRLNPNGQLTGAASVTWQVTFSEHVNNVSTADFTLVDVSGTITGESVVSVSASSGTTIDVTVNTGTSGNGDLRLDVLAGTATITDDTGDSLNASFTSGQVYTIDHTRPTVLSINRQNPNGQITGVTSMVYRVTFSKHVNNVSTADFTLVDVSGTITGESITSVSASSGTTMDVTVNTGTSGNGDLRLDVLAGTATVTDDAGNSLITSFTNGQVYTIYTVWRGPSFINTGSMNAARDGHTATLLPNGKVLVAGGVYRSSAELYDPATGTWTTTGAMGAARAFHSTTLLGNGKVLVVGGYNGSTPLSAAELYDPATGMWTTTGSLGTARFYHTSTLLPNGKVLVTGGEGNAPPYTLANAEVYDPTTGTWTATGSMNTNRMYHTASLLSNGKVLVAGGSSASVYSFSSAEVYDPATGTWTMTGAMITARGQHTSTLLPTGNVLVAGGYGGYITSTELYNPIAGTWTVAGPLSAARYSHTATLLPNGKVLVTGGNGSPISSAELYDPAAGTWATTSAMNTNRAAHTATLLANGKVLIAGGDNNYNGYSIASAELYDFAGGTWAATGPLTTARGYHAATLLPSGLVLVSGGYASLSSAEVYDPANGTWVATGAMIAARFSHTATLLPNGKVLAAGGWNGSAFLSSAELYDSASGIWTATGMLTTNRYLHTATLLANGKVLVAGGNGGSRLCELYDAASGTWTTTGTLSTGRQRHTATLLPNGKVLVVGGDSAVSSAELYDPVAETWALTGSLNTARGDHTATLLPNGNVLVAGGWNPGVPYLGALSSAELYNPDTGTWIGTGGLNTNRADHTATLLSNGKVLVAGGINSSSSTISSADVYDPAIGTWTTIVALNTNRSAHTATLLPNGKALIAGGYSSASGYHSSAEVYDVGLDFNASRQPQIATVTSSLNLGGRLLLTGSRFRGVSGGSGGNSQDSPTDYPMVQLRSLESGQTAFLSTTNWSTNSFTSLPVTTFPLGYALATVLVNGIPSTGVVLRVSVPAPTLIGAKILGNGSFQFTFTNSTLAGFTVLSTTNVSTPSSNWVVAGTATNAGGGLYQFSDTSATNYPQRFYQLRWP